MTAAHNEVRNWRVDALCVQVDPEHVDRTTNGDHGVSALVSVVRQIVLLAWVKIRIGSLLGWCCRSGAVS